jgi:subtilase family serine protease
VQYPAAAASVLAVGGTSLSLDSHGNYLSESTWGGSGSGLSAFEFEPFYQAGFGIPDDQKGVPGVPDVSYNARPRDTRSTIRSPSKGKQAGSGWAAPALPRRSGPR